MEHACIKISTYSIVIKMDIKCVANQVNSGALTLKMEKIYELEY